MRGGLFDGALSAGHAWETATSCPPDQVENARIPKPKAEYKEVVIVGNGPSAICLSYVLAGNWPYYGEAAHPLGFLHHRLDANRTLPLVLQDLRLLCEGLEGRSNNPVSVLFDTLNHPDADLGVEAPSFLKWAPNRDKCIDHVVLGRGPPGGAWQRMEQNALTLSLSHWMELPNMSYKEWEQERIRDHTLTAVGKQSRALVANVARYYRDYVKRQQLERHFRNHCVVTSVQRLGHDAEEDGARHKGSERRYWEVQGYCARDQKPFRYISPNVVLATGSYDRPNRIRVPGEDLPFVLHSSSKLEQLIVEQRLGAHSDPVLVVGAGLTAADAILTARFYGVPVAHAFRRDADDPSLIFNRLPENMYPEYHKVHQMMKGRGAGYHGYRCYAKHQLVEILPGHKARLEGPEASAALRVSTVLVLIGSRPDTSFLKPDAGARLGSDPGRPIDCKRNLIQVDAFTHESVHEEGLFALGPLVGDNFVRFIQGGALAVANHLVRQRAPSNGISAATAAADVEERLRHLDTEDLVAASSDPDLRGWVQWKSWQEEVHDEEQGRDSDAPEDADETWTCRAAARRRPQRRKRSSHSACDKTSVG